MVPHIENMPHPDVQREANYQRTSTQIDSQMRELRIDAESVPKVQEIPHADQSGRPRNKSAHSQRSAFSVIMEEDAETSQVGSPERLAQSPSHLTRFDQQDIPYESSSSSHTSIRGHSRKHSSTSSVETYETKATSTVTAQHGKTVEGADTMDSVLEDEATSYDLAPPLEEGQKLHTMETLSEILFSREHLQTIFADPSSLLKFTAFLSTYRPRSVPILIYYLDAMKALKAINYANALAEALEPIAGYDFTILPAKTTMNSVLEDKANQAFTVLIQQDLPAYITHIYVQVTHSSVVRRITGATALRSQDASDGLAEIFCLSDPSRPDNPIVFASEEFTRTTQYGMSYIIGRNCRFLQGPNTGPFSVRRIRNAVEAGREHCEVFLNYRRDGSPFLNLLMCAPLYDNSGKIRYFLGAQVDISSTVNEGTDLDSLQRLVEQKERGGESDASNEEKKDEFQQLSEMLDIQELNAVRKWGGRMLQETQEEDNSAHKMNWRRPTVLLRDPSRDHIKSSPPNGSSTGSMVGFYHNYLLIRPYPSLRILFASPSLRVPGILQSPLMNRIGGSVRVRDELTQALAEGRGVTAKVRWVSRPDDDGRNRWIHCTPLFGSNGQIGVWMLVVVDDEQDDLKRSRQAPPVAFNMKTAHAMSDTAGSVNPGESAWQFNSEAELDAISGWAESNGIAERRTKPSDWTLAALRREGTNNNTDTEEDEEGYQTLEERLANRKRLEAERMYDQPGSAIPLRRTYKSLSPYPFSLDD